MGRLPTGPATPLNSDFLLSPCPYARIRNILHNNNTNKSTSHPTPQFGLNCQHDAPLLTNTLEHNSYKHGYSPTELQYIHQNQEINTGTLLSPNSQKLLFLRIRTKFTYCYRNILYSYRIQLKTVCVTFSCGLQSRTVFLSLSLTLMTVTLLKVMGQLFC